jgi:hypothetical protein
MLSKQEKAELYDVCRGVLRDGTVDDAEANQLRGWLGRHPDFHISFPGNRLCEVLQRALNDGRLDVDERIEIEDLLHSLLGYE